jgi:uncharacterized short protein YbdD (DUF466 family)
MKHGDTPGTSLRAMRSLWRSLRALTGDDAYERYLAHWRKHHAHEGGEPPDRKSFFQAELERKWAGVKRCC